MLSVPNFSIVDCPFTFGFAFFSLGIATVAFPWDQKHRSTSIASQFADKKVPPSDSEDIMFYYLSPPGVSNRLITFSPFAKKTKPKKTASLQQSCLLS
jgi:hypothetical protein